MSWIAATIAILVVAFAGIFAFCEWFVARPRRRHDDDAAPG